MVTNLGGVIREAVPEVAGVTAMSSNAQYICAVSASLEAWYIYY